MARLAVNTLVTRVSYPSYYATICVNLAGCAIIGTLGGLLASGRVSMGPTLRLFVFVGILGGFTTFSAFGLDTFALARGGRYSEVFWNVTLNVVIGLLAVGGGFGVGLRL